MKNGGIVGSNTINKVLPEINPKERKKQNSGKKISSMKMLKSVKDVLKHYNNKCPSCNQTLSTTEFSLDVEEK